MISFWYKSGHNVLPCHYTLSLWYPEHSPECRLDGCRLGSISHVLNGCKEIKNNYSKRHDNILDKVVSELKHHCNEIFVNKMIRGSFREFTEKSEHRSELNLNPITYGILTFRQLRGGFLAQIQKTRLQLTD